MRFERALIVDIETSISKSLIAFMWLLLHFS